MTELSIEEINDIEAFRSLRELWNNLLQRSGDNNVFLTWEWLFTWWRHYRGDKQLRILLVKEQDNIIGIAPLMERQYQKGPFHIKILENICSEECDYSGVILTERINESMATLLDYFINITGDGKTVVRMWHIPEKSNFFTVLKNKYPSYAKSLSLNSRISSLCPYIDLPATWDELYRTLGKNTRKAMRLLTNRLERKFKVEFQKYSGDDDLRSKLEILFNFHQKRWQQKNIGSKFQEAQSREFYTDVSKAFYEKGWLDFSFLNLDGKTVSVEWSFNYDGIYWDMTHSFDLAYSRHSVGNIHTMYLLKAAIGNGLQKFDLLKGSENYKSHYTKNQASNALIDLSHNSFAAMYRVKILKILIKYDNSSVRKPGDNFYYLLRRIRRHISKVLRK